MSTGLRIANIVTDSLLGKGLSYDVVSKIVYGICSDISEASEIDDWLEFPDGTTATITFKPKGS